MQAAAAAGFVLSSSTLPPIVASEPPVKTSIPAYGHGIDFDGVLGGIYVTPADPQKDAFAEVWVVTHPKGTLIMHHAFSQRGVWYWFADPNEEIIGSINVCCSVDADILLAGKPRSSMAEALKPTIWMKY